RERLAGGARARGRDRASRARRWTRGRDRGDRQRTPRHGDPRAGGRRSLAHRDRARPRVPRGRDLARARSGARMTRVYLVEDETLVREGLCALLALAPQIEVLGAAGDGEAALAIIPRV